jgi:hypothetical protein
MAEMYRRDGCVCMSESDFMALVASRIEVAREADGRWIAEIPALPGCMVYGEIEDTARQAVEALALRIMQTERWTDAGDPPVAA